MAKTKNVPTKSTPTKSTHGYRSSWKGQLTFGLVSFTVEAFNAFDREKSDIHFHQIHAKCHRRIKYQKVCPVHGEVSNDEIVSGYEVKKGQYVEIEKDKIKSLKKESDSTLRIEAFIAPETIDPLYFDGRMYYLAPISAASHEPYAVIVGAMEKEKRCGVGSVIMSGKDQIVLVRPLDGVLHMAMLNYHAEIRKPSSVVHVAKSSKALTREIGMAQAFIEQWSEDEFDFSKYEDTHRRDVEKLIAEQSKRKKIAVVMEEEEPAPVLNLMEALKKSMHTRPKGKSPRRAA